MPVWAQCILYVVHVDMMILYTIFAFILVKCLQLCNRFAVWVQPRAGSSPLLMFYILSIRDYAFLALFKPIHEIIQSHPVTAAAHPRARWIRAVSGRALDAIHGPTGRLPVDAHWMLCGCAFVTVANPCLLMAQPAAAVLLLCLAYYVELVLLGV